MTISDKTSWHIFGVRRYIFLSSESSQQSILHWNAQDGLVRLKADIFLAKFVRTMHMTPPLCVICGYRACSPLSIRQVFLCWHFFFIRLALQAHFVLLLNFLISLITPNISKTENDFSTIIKLMKIFSRFSFPITGKYFVDRISLYNAGDKMKCWWWNTKTQVKNNKNIKWDVRV